MKHLYLHTSIKKILTSFLLFISCMHQISAGSLEMPSVRSFGRPAIGDSEIKDSGNIAVDTAGNMYLSSFDNKQCLIKKFNSSGTLLRSFGRCGSATGEIQKSPFTMYSSFVTVDSSGDIYVSDTGNNRIQKFDTNGNFIFSIGSYGTSTGQFISPLGIVTDSQKNLYVSDGGIGQDGFYNSRIQKFDSNGYYLTSWGSSGVGNGQFFGPAYFLDIDASDTIYVTDNYRIQKFSTIGTYLSKVNLGYTLSGGIKVFPNGDIYVSDPSHNLIKRYNAGWTLLGSFGLPNTFAPSGLARSSSGDLIVVENLFHRVMLFSPTTGTLLSTPISFSYVNDDLYRPKKVMFDTSQNMYILDSSYEAVVDSVNKYDQNGNVLWRIDPRGIIVASSTYSSFKNIDDMVVSPNGTVYIMISNASYAGGDGKIISWYDSITGAYIGAFGTSGTTTGKLNTPYSLTTDSTGNLYVLDTGDGISGNARLQSFTATGTLRYAQNLYGISHYFAGSDATNLYIGDEWHVTINRHNKNTGALQFSWEMTTWDSTYGRQSSPEEENHFTYATTTPLTLPSACIRVLTPYDDTINDFATSTKIAKFTTQGDPVYMFTVPHIQASFGENYSCSHNDFSFAGYLYLVDTRNNQILIYKESDLITNYQNWVSLSLNNIPFPIVSPIQSLTFTSSGGGFSGGSYSPSFSNNFSKDSFSSYKTIAPTLTVNQGKQEISSKNISVSVSAQAPVQKIVYKLFDKKNGSFVGSTTRMLSASSSKSNVNTAIVICELFQKVKCQKGSYTLASEVAIENETSRVFLNDIIITDKALSQVGFSFSRTLSQGNKGSEVVALQELLKTKTVIFASSTPSGYYGKLTVKAVQEFQCTQHIICSGTPEKTGWGIVGKKTREVFGK